MPLERVAFEAGGAPWFQLYLPPSRDEAAAAVARAREAGCEALVLTTDVPVGGNREYNERNGLSVPLRVAVMGCVVNGPGEAREADLGVASGNGKGQIFVRGEVVKTVPEAQIVETLVAEALRLAETMTETGDPQVSVS